MLKEVNPNSQLGRVHGLPLGAGSAWPSHQVKMATAENTYLCGFCEVLIKQNVRSIECSGYCPNWYHLKCTELSDSDFKCVSYYQIN